ncbi:MAG: hypothetical protein ACYDAQ_12125 [Mycobacteriales bacterium]
MRQQQRLGERLGDNRTLLADLQRDRMARDVPRTSEEFNHAWPTLGQRFPSSTDVRRCSLTSWVG